MSLDSSHLNVPHDKHHPQANPLPKGRRTETMPSNHLPEGLMRVMGALVQGEGESKRPIAAAVTR